MLGLLRVSRSGLSRQHCGSCVSSMPKLGERVGCKPAIEPLSENPRPPGAKKLVGGDREWRVRTGGYRIVYEIH